MTKLFKIVIDTEQYSGNFEREMCAYITGQIGECSVGDNFVEAFGATIQNLEWWENHIVQRPDDREYPTYRPVSIYPTNGWHNNGRGGHFKDDDKTAVKFPAYMSVAIFTDESPPESVVMEVCERAREFCSNYSDLKNQVSRINHTENLTFTGVRIIRGVNKETLLSEIKFN